MFNKKYILIASLFSAMALKPALAQESQNSSNHSGRDMTYRGESYDVLDSTFIKSKRMDQHRKFLDNQYAYPSKPRNQWELGIHMGLYNVSGDVPSLMLWQHGGGGIGFHVRKALGYVISLRGDYTYGVAKGLQWQASDGALITPNTAINGTNNVLANYVGKMFFNNYRMESHQLTLDVIASLANIRFHRAHTGVSFYAFAGFGDLAYQTWINALNGNTPYKFENILYNNYGLPNQTSKYPNGVNHKDRKNVKKDLFAMLDHSYETDAQSQQYSRRSKIFGHHTQDMIYSFGFGSQLRINKRVNFSIEDRITGSLNYNEDLMDGQKWELTGNRNDASISQNRDGINYFNVGLNFNLGAGRRNVEPLYWLNPLDFSYGELNSPRRMNIPGAKIDDADGDGIADQFDKCPGTPAGVAVDSHGCPIDTDGDGVPDDRDKQLITPTECQPVDADGIGKCPCPDCGGRGVGPACGTIGSGTINFSAGSSKISPAMTGQLAALAAQMSANPGCKVVVSGNGGNSKAEQQRSWDRVNSVIEYMSEKHNVDRNRFIFRYEGNAGTENAVNYRSAMAGEEGPSNVAPPHPNLRH